jgi:hypothetical protein
MELRLPLSSHEGKTTINNEDELSKWCIVRIKFNCDLGVSPSKNTIASRYIFWWRKLLNTTPAKVAFDANKTKRRGTVGSATASYEGSIISILGLNSDYFN